MPTPSHLKPSPFTARVPADLTEEEWIDVAGQATPERITGTDAEYRAFRTGVGMIDFSMLPKWEITGPGAIDVLNAVFSRDVTKLEPGSIAYGVVVTEDGRMMDDCTVLVYGDDHVRLTGGNWEVEDVIRTHLTPETSLTELRDTLATLSVQGPRSRETLQKLTSTDLSNEAFPYYTFQTGIDLAGIPAHINRMGFTAELGYEVMVPIERAIELWDAVAEAGAEFGAIGCGGGALMIVRVEAGMVMGGLEYDEDTTPFECRMGWAVDLEKQHFHGREALVALKEQARRTIASLVIESAPDELEGAVILHDGAEVGHVTMAVPSPELGGETLALARVAKGHAAKGTSLTVRTPDGEAAARVVATPVYDPQRLKVRS
ncbi:aminomethyltransferase family protein [Leucobacter celer]|uniref:aminomethyltransferase family protein n=1 Tax=Leucobacter celer TaxID=668625 RepID=UPI0006A777B6|nr:aminomethyltransferase family protein [Leucobacter celer]